MKHVALAFLILGACSSDNGGGGGVDAPAGAAFSEVSCSSSTADATIMTMGSDTTGKYSPSSVTITQGQVVKLVADTIHDFLATGGTSTAINTHFGETKCFKFTQPGTYKFLCSSHGFSGMIVVN